MITNPPSSIPAVSFSVEEGDGHFWICDAGRRVVLFIRMPAGSYYCNAVFLRQPDDPAPEFPESYHSATAIGLQADIRWRWGRDWQPMKREKLELGEETATVAFSRRTADGRNEQSIDLVLRRTGTGPTDYALRCHARLLADAIPGQSIEFLNFLPANAGNSWEDRKRFRSTVHEYAPGHYERRPHSQLTVIEPYYWPDATGFRRPQVTEPAFAEVYNPSLRAHSVQAPFATSHLFKPMAPAGVLFFSGEEVTPTVRIIRANTPVVLHTCDVWYDEHVCLERGVTQSDGRQLYEAEYELFGLPAEESARLTAQARLVDFSSWVQAHEFAAFHSDRPNHFDRPAAREYDGATGLFFAYENPAHLLSWRRQTDLPNRGALELNTVDPVEPPSGQYYQSVRYDLAGERSWAEAFPLGFSLHIARGETVEFSARVRTEGAAEAWLEMREAFWGKVQRESLGQSEPQIVRTEVVASAQWTQVPARLTARIPGSLSMIFLSMRGRGRAAFTELEVRGLSER
jgi:hypothetical protein